MNILFIGDIFGQPGRQTVIKVLPELREREEIDLVLANGENLANGKGMTYDTYQEMEKAGIDYFTSGNHIWAKREFIPYLDDKKIKVLRPANYPEGVPGRGYVDLRVKSLTVRVINLQGRVFMDEGLESPFKVADEIIKTRPKPDIIMVDFHAEATSEKNALGYYLDGRVSAIVGTHTHIQTNDAHILPKGTAYVTDVGFVGPLDSVIGVEKEIVIEHFLKATPVQHEVGSGKVLFNAIILKIEKSNKIFEISLLKQFL